MPAWNGLLRPPSEGQGLNGPAPPSSKSNAEAIPLLWRELWINNSGSGGQATLETLSHSLCLAINRGQSAFPRRSTIHFANSPKGRGSYEEAALTAITVLPVRVRCRRRGQD